MHALAPQNKDGLPGVETLGQLVLGRFPDVGQVLRTGAIILSPSFLLHPHTHTHAHLHCHLPHTVHKLEEDGSSLVVTVIPISMTDTLQRKIHDIVDS